MSAQRVNWAGVVMSTLLYFSIGALWYSPLLFTNPWLRLIGKPFDEVKAHGAAPYEYALVAAVLISYGLERAIRACGIAGALRGAATGIAVAIVFATAAAAPGYLFEMRPLSLFAINAGYPVVGMALCGALLGCFRGTA